MFRLVRFLLLLLLLVLAVLGTYFWINRISSVEKFLSQKLNTPVTVEEVSLSWNRLSLQELKIANPRPKKLPYAFETKEIVLEMSPWQLLQSTMHIKRVKVIDPLLSIELYNSSGSRNNWADLLNGIPASSGDREFVIEELAFLNLSFQAVRSNGQAISLPVIPYLEFENIGSKNPLSINQLGRLLFQTILNSLSKKGLDHLLEKVPPLPPAFSEGASSSLPFEDELKGFLQEGYDTMKKKTKEASDYLQDLFSKEQPKSQ